MALTTGFLLAFCARSSGGNAAIVPYWFPADGDHRPSGEEQPDLPVQGRWGRHDAWPVRVCEMTKTTTQELHVSVSVTAKRRAPPCARDRTNR